MRFLPAAVEEIHHAIAWYETQRPGLGKIFVDAIDDALTSIEADPTRFAIIYREVRMSLVKRFPYAIYFREKGGQVEIVSIFHASRDPSEWQQRN